MRHLERLPLALLLALGSAACGDNLTPPAASAPYVGAEPAPLSCVPNLDGKLEAAELEAAIGIPVSYRVSPPGAERVVDVTGRVDADGHRTWDWAEEASEPVARIAASPLAGKWYAASFPGGEFATAFDAGGSLEAVYSKDDEALWLLGIASAEPDPAAGRTLLVYDAKVALFRFPLEDGASWLSAGTVQNGVVRDLPYAGRDSYEVTVDGSGRLDLPDLSFTQVHRVRTRVTTEPAVGAPASRRQVSFLFECFGEVARATSRPDEPEEDFTTAAEIRRLGL